MGEELLNKEFGYEVFKVLAESDLVGLYIFTTDGFIYVNKLFELTTGYTLSELQEKHLKPWDLLYYESDRKAVIEVAQRREKGEILSVPWTDLRIITKNSKILWGKIIGTTAKYNGRYVSIATFIDITEEHFQREKLHNLERIHATLSSINQMLVRVKDKERIFENLCRIAVEIGKFRASWIGFEENGIIRPKYIYGYGKESISTLEFNTADESKYLLTLKTFNRKNVYINQNTYKNSSMNPYREWLIQNNFISLASLPIVEFGKIIGVFNVYSDKENFFDNETYKLLKEMTMDIEYTLEKIEIDKQNYILSSALEGTTDWVVITDLNGTITYVNKGFEKISGYKKDEVLGKSTRILKSGVHDKSFYERFWKTIKSGQTYNGLFVNKRKDGSIVYLDKTVVPIKIDDKINYFVSIDKDVTQIKEYENTIYKSLFYDPITDLPNIKLFTSEFSKILKENFDNQPLTLVLIGLRNFGHINSLFGYETGNKVLRVIANYMNEIKERKLIARLTGDNFGIIFYGGKDTVMEKIDEIKKLLDEALHINYSATGVSYNMGISFFSDDGQKSNVLISKANIALSNARNIGEREISFFDKKIEVEMRNTFMMKHSLKMALEQKEFVLFFQPYFDVKTSKVVGMEALIRWKKDDRIVLPNDFIPILEQSSMMVELERWIFEKAFEKLREWKMKNLSIVPISLNISPQTFGRADFVDNIFKYLKAYEVEPELLNIEVTERLFITNISYAIETLNKLRKAGVRVSIDDFGTGYSSFSYLKDLPVDVIKIDISFVKQICTDEKVFAIVDAIISLSKKLGIKTVAEGVERQEQLELLKRSRCDMIQGFLLSKPLNEEEIIEYMDHNRL